MRAAEVGLWSPGNERVSAIGATLREHWMAAKAVARSQFWVKPASWHDPRYHLTIGGRLMRYASGSASVPKPNLVPRS